MSSPPRSTKQPYRRRAAPWYIASGARIFSPYRRLRDDDSQARSPPRRDGRGWLGGQRLSTLSTRPNVSRWVKDETTDATSVLDDGTRSSARRGAESRRSVATAAAASPCFSRRCCRLQSASRSTERETFHARCAFVRPLMKRRLAQGSRASRRSTHGSSVISPARVAISARLDEAEADGTCLPEPRPPPPRATLGACPATNRRRRHHARRGATSKAAEAIPRPQVRRRGALRPPDEALRLLRRFALTNARYPRVRGYRPTPRFPESIGFIGAYTLPTA